MTLLILSVVGVPEEKVLEIKHEEIQNRSKTSFCELSADSIHHNAKNC